MKQTITKLISTNSLACALLALCLSSDAIALNCPFDLAIRLHRELKNHLSWVDINFEPKRAEMTLRYYPCFASRQAIDTLLEDAMQKQTADCMIIRHGNHRHTEGYCVLEKLIVGRSS